MSDTYGPMYETPLARWDRPTSSWRTCAATSLWDLPMSSLTLPTWGCLRGGELYELPTPEPATVEQGCSSLPTPNARDYEGSPSAAWSTQASLPRAIKELPTPTAQAAKHMTMDDRGVGTLDDHNLWSVASRLLPTPAVNDMGAGKDPQAWDEWSARQKAADGRPAPHGKSLEQEALKMLPTPQAGDGFGQNDNLNNRRAHKASPYSDLPRTVAKDLIGVRTHQPLTAGSASWADLLQPLPFAEPIGTA